MIRDHQVREIAHCLVLRSLQRQLTRLDLELVAAGGVGQEARRQQQVVEIDRRWRRWWWRRRGLTGGEHQRAAKQNRQFPHRFSPHFWIVPAWKPARKPPVPTIHRDGT